MCANIGSVNAVSDTSQSTIGVVQIAIITTNFASIAGQKTIVFELWTCVSNYPLDLPGLPRTSAGPLDLSIGFCRNDFLSLMSSNDLRMCDVPKHSGTG